MTEQEFKEVKDYVLKEIELWDSRTGQYGVPITPYEFILMWIEGHCTNKCWSDTVSAGKQYKGIKGMTYTTYGLKHRIEVDLPRLNGNGGYCANNWVKCALYDLGYDLKESEWGGEPTKDDMLNNGVNLVWRKIK